MTPPTTLQGPPPTLSVKHWHKNRYVANAPSVLVHAVSDADKKKKKELEAMSKHVVVQKPRPKPTVRLDPLVFCVHNGIPKIVKHSVLMAYKQRMSAKYRETKIDMEVKRGKPVVISGPSGKRLVTSSKTVKCSRAEAKKNTLQMRRDFFVHRVFLHIVNFGLQAGNLAGLYDILGSNTTTDPRLTKFLAMRFRFFTTWVVMLHIFYSASALVKLYKQNEQTKKGNTNPAIVLKTKSKLSLEGLFRGILWPSSLVVTVFFWTLYNYDRDLIFPMFIDEIISWGSNQIMHTWITIFVLLEVMFNPRLRPLNYGKSLRVMFIFLAVYLSVFYYTLFTEDFWLYPIFSVAYDGGIVYFLILHLVLLVLFLISYILLWRVNDHFHKHRQFFIKKTQLFLIRWDTPAVKE